jgi:hypothetical protein
MYVADALALHGRCLTLQAAPLALGRASRCSMAFSMRLMAIFFASPVPFPWLTGPTMTCFIAHRASGDTTAPSPG